MTIRLRNNFKTSSWQQTDNLDGHEDQTLQHLPQLIAKTKHYKSKKNLRTFQAEKRAIFKNRQLQTNFTSSYKKEFSYGTTTIRQNY